MCSSGERLRLKPFESVRENESALISYRYRSRQWGLVDYSSLSLKMFIGSLRIATRVAQCFEVVLWVRKQEGTRTSFSILDRCWPDRLSGRFRIHLSYVQAIYFQFCRARTMKMGNSCSSAVCIFHRRSIAWIWHVCPTKFGSVRSGVTHIDPDGTRYFHTNCQENWKFGRDGVPSTSSSVTIHARAGDTWHNDQHYLIRIPSDH